MVRKDHYLNFFTGTCLLLVLFMLSSVQVQAQENENGPIIFDRFYNKPRGAYNIRHLLNRLSFGVSSGYGKTYYKHEFDNAAIIQKPGFQPIIFNPTSLITNDTITTAYVNWFNQVEGVGSLPINTATDYITSTDSTRIVYKSTSRGIPIVLTLHYDFLKYRIGVGMSWEYHKVKEFNPKYNTANLASFQPEIQKERFKRYFAYLGGRVWNYYDYSAVVDAQIGLYNLGVQFVDPKGIYFNLGVSVEKEFSEYFSAFVRPSIEYKRFQTSLPETALSVNHNMPSIFLNVGVQMNLPELRKCKISNCETQINHTHGGGKEWRSRSHPFYKKQNPHYGENYPRLYKYKWLKKNKLNPY
ncbi:MAG: hypothetical protein OEX22_02495 [Cyclobacteriaceae bacterium]|nr:hypothetical protein [Cyclobacteriaceae bacterium]